MIGISKCLIGENCTYKGDNNYTNWVKQVYETYPSIVICPEVLGGLSTPRLPAEIIQKEPLKLINSNGQDVTKEFILGAQKAIKLLKNNNIQLLITKSNSPSCGYKYIYDGTFSKTLIDGNGVFIQEALKLGIKIITEKDEKLFQEYSKELKNNEIII